MIRQTFEKVFSIINQQRNINKPHRTPQQNGQ